MGGRGGKSYSARQHAPPRHILSDVISAPRERPSRPSPPLKGLWVRPPTYPTETIHCTEINVQIKNKADKIPSNLIF